MSKDKQPDDDASLFQKEMAKTNTVDRRDQASRFDRYEQTDKPRAMRSHDGSHGEYLSTDVPGHAAIDQTTHGESVLFVRAGLQRKVIRRLKRGEYPCQSVLDLHGMKIHEAETLLTRFLSAAMAQNESCVLIVHGKGYHSQNSKGVLKPFTINWLRQRAEVKAFCSANPKDGGSGAVYVLLRTGWGGA